MRYTWGSLEYCWKPFTGLIDFFFYYRSSTSLGLECSVLNQCSASGLFRSNFSFPFLIIMESIVTSANRMTHAALVHCFCCSSCSLFLLFLLVCSKYICTSEAVAKQLRWSVKPQEEPWGLHCKAAIPDRSEIYVVDSGWMETMEFQRTLVILVP